MPIDNYRLEVTWNQRVLCKGHKDVRHVLEDLRGWKFFFEGVPSVQLKAIGDFRVIEDITYVDGEGWKRAPYLPADPKPIVDPEKF